MATPLGRFPSLRTVRAMRTKTFLAVWSRLFRYSLSPSTLDLDSRDQLLGPFMFLPSRRRRRHLRRALHVARLLSSPARRFTRSPSHDARRRDPAGAFGFGCGSKQPSRFPTLPVSRRVAVPTVLHISDLHRTPNHHLGNDVLLPALLSDAERWEEEGIPKPVLIIVSGDLVQGASLDDCDADAKIEDQYREADSFLGELAEALLDSDRSRVIIVPGNHDVHWRQCLVAMEPLASFPTDIATKSLQPTSGLRWNWRERQVYGIQDVASYASRLAHFRRFRDHFYRNVEPNPSVHGSDDLVFFDYPALDLCVAGFSSCHGNDCFCRVGSIQTASMISARELVSGSSAAIAVAVWHHGILGGPREQDYLDRYVVHKLIDFGFTVGFHGHQHYPDAAPFNLRLPNLTSMVVVGAGSLAVGDPELPMGEPRQFNVVDLDPAKKSVTVHVRSMSPGGVFSGFHRTDFGGATFLELPLPPARSNRVTPSGLQALDDAMTALADGRPLDALERLDQIPPSHDETTREIAKKALRVLERFEELVELLIPPRSQAEAIEAVSVLLFLNRIDDAKNLREESLSLLSPGASSDLRETIAAKEMLP